MISVIIPTFNDEATLSRTLCALVPAAIDGVVRDVVIADGSSRDLTIKIAESAGAEVVVSAVGLGIQMMTGASTARSPWLLFLHADTVLSDDWHQEAAKFMSAVDHGHIKPAAAAFRLRLEGRGLFPRLIEKLVALRCFLFKLPYGDQGLLIPANLYRAVGGHPEVSLMQDIALVSRLGRARIRMIDATAETQGSAYRRQGYVRRLARNQICLALHALGVPIRTIARIYAGSSQKA